MKFRNIIGHQKQLEQLENDLNSDNLAHAYLFAGPEDLGKYKIARLFAEELQTNGLDDESSLRIKNLMKTGAHLDSVFIRRETENQTIKIEEIRKILDNLQMTGDSSFRVLVMEDIERLTPEAANAMLKMLEEPPEKVCFILTTSKPSAVLETILSRVRRIDFGVMLDEDLNDALSRRYRLMDHNKINEIVEMSGGKIAKAIKLAENSEMLEAYEDVYRQIENFLNNGKITEAFQFIGKIYEDRLLVKIFIEIGFVVLRKRLLSDLQANQRSSIISDVTKLEKLYNVKNLSETNVNNRLLLENFILSL
ncbi:AAA family ATPase [Candidatus Peregrinibacteria bacterium]|nr:AAA family ATPase [Candidatus Peregrinibacteria bacterium]